MDGDLFLLPMMLVHIAPLAGLEAVAEIEEADVVRPLRVRRRVKAVHLRGIGAAPPLHVLHRPEALLWALRVAAVVC